MGLDLPRHRLIRLDIRAVLDLLHSQVDGEVAQGPIRSPHDRNWQKDFPTREPLAGVDDQPSNGPADILKQQVANCPEQPIARLDGIAIDCRCIPQHCSLLYADRMELFDLVRAAMARRSIPSGDRRRSAIGRVTDPPRGDENRSATSELPSIFATSATDRLPKVTGPILASGHNGGRLGNYADPKVVNAARMKYDRVSQSGCSLLRCPPPLRHLATRS